MPNRSSRVIAAAALALSIAALSGCSGTIIDFSAYPTPPAFVGIPHGTILQVGEIKDTRRFDDPTTIIVGIWLDRPVATAVREALIMELKSAGYLIGESDVLVSGNLTAFSVGWGASDPIMRYSLSVTVTKGTQPKPIFSKTYQSQSTPFNITDTHAILQKLRECVIQFPSDYLLQQAVATHNKEKLVQSGKKQVASDVDRVTLTQPAAKKNAHAVVIGIEDYQQKLPKADYAAHDAEIMGQYLTTALGYQEENVVVLLNDRATKTSMEKYVEGWLVDRVEKDDSVFIYFSGHGAPNPKTGKAFLVPHDGDPAFIEKTGYQLDRLYEQLATLPAKEVVVMLDSCFSGAGERSVIAPGVRPMVLSVENPLLTKGRTMVLTAGASDQVSSTYLQEGHGLLTYFFLKGLQGDADQNNDKRIELRELFEYLKPQVERTARREFHNEQTPQLIGSPETLSKGIVLIEGNK